MNNWKCQNCIYYRGDDSDNLFTKDGVCHRYPPTTVKDADLFPSVDMNDFCGEWKEIPGNSEEE